MNGLALLGLIIAALAALDIAAIRWGADSRVGFERGRDRTGLEI